MKDDLFILEENRRQDVSREEQVWKKMLDYCVSDYSLSLPALFFLSPTDVNDVN